MTGGIEASIAFEPTARTIDLIYASVQRSGRIPTYTDLYYSDPQTKGDSTLAPEDAITVEGGFRRTAGTLSLQAAVFRRDGRNLIDYIIMDNGTQQAANITRVIITGVDMNVTWNVNAAVFASVRVGFTYQDVNSSASAQTRYVADNLRTQGIVDTRWVLPLDINASYLIRVLERATDPTVHVVHDVRLQRTFGIVTPMLEITNITSESYIETGWVTVPPRWARVGVQVGV
jgi:iron complex outermembrane receptor protein